MSEQYTEEQMAERLANSRKLEEWMANSEQRKSTNTDASDILDGYETQLAAEKEEEAAKLDDLKSRNLEAFGTAAADTFSLGALDHVKSDERKAHEKDLANANPIVSLMGDLVGGAAQVAPVVKGLQMAGKTPTAIGAASRAIGLSPATRTVAAGAGGALQGVVYAANKGDNPIAGGLIGAGGGLVGQAVLGELLPGLFKFKSGHYSEKDMLRAKKQLAERVQMANPNMPEDVASKLVDIMEDLGPDAKLLDVDDALYKAGISLMKHRPNAKMGADLGEALKARYENNQELVGDLLNAALDKTSSYGPAASKAQAKQAMQYLSPFYKEAMANSSVYARHSDLLEEVGEAFGEVDPVTGRRVLTTSAQSGQNTLERFLKNNATIDGEKPKGGRWTDDGTYRVKVGTNPDGSAVYDFIEPDEWSATAINTMVKQLDDMYKDASDPFSPAVNKGLSANIASLRNKLKSYLNDDENIAELSKMYKDEHLYNTGYEYGSKLITTLNTKKVDEDALRLWTENADELELAAMMEGAKYQLGQMIDEGGQEALTKLINRSSATRAKLENVLGNDLANGLITAAKSVSKFSKNDADMYKAIQHGAKPRPSSAGVAADVLTGLGGLLTDKVSNIAAVGAGRRASQAIHPTANATDSAFAELLNSSGDEAKTLLQNLLREETYGPAFTNVDLGSMGAGGAGALGVAEAVKDN